MHLTTGVTQKATDRNVLLIIKINSFANTEAIKFSPVDNLKLLIVATVLL